MQSENQDSKKEPKLWYGRGYLPHFDGGPIPQFITFRLAGTLPVQTLSFYKDQRNRDLISEIEYHQIIADYLDRGRENVFLRDSRVARMIEENLRRFNGMKYKLHAWVIMPNHVHILLTPLEEISLASIMHSMKSYTANRANRLLDRDGGFWAKEYFDRYIRTGDHFVNTVEYIHNNPVKAKLCCRAEDWPFSSARLPG